MEYGERDVWIGGTLVTLEYDPNDCNFEDK